MNNRTLRRVLKVTAVSGVLFVLIALGLALVPAAIYYIDRELSGDIALLRTRQRLPSVQGRYDQLAEELQSVTAGEILEAQLGNVWVSRSYPDCIRSGGTLMYRSRASYEEIARIYSQSLQNLGWSKIVSVTSGRTRGVSQISFGLNNGSAILSLALLSEFSAGLPEYQTIYEIRFYFAEPSIAVCYG